MRKLLRIMLLAVVALSIFACTTGKVDTRSTTDQYLADLATERTRMATSGLISGTWSGSSRCQAPGVRNSAVYPIKLTLQNRGNESYEGTMTIKGIRRNGGVLTQLENINVTVNNVNGEYRIKTRIFMPFLKQAIAIELDRDANIIALNFNTIQRCRNFRLKRA